MIADMKMEGEVRLHENFAKLPAKVRDIIMKRAMRKTAAPIKEAAAARARRRTGALGDSVDYKISSKGAKGAVVYCAIGPKTNVKVPVRIVQHGAHAGQLLVAIPTRYAHLIEFGHQLVVHGKVAGYIAPFPFMRGAWASNGGSVALATFSAEMVTGVEETTWTS